MAALTSPRRLMCAAILAAGVVTAVACGGGGGGGANIVPTLVGTVIPTVSPVPPTAAVCAPPEQLALPGAFPQEVVVPPDLVVYSIKTTPHLQVIGRVPPPTDPTSNEVPFGIVAFAVTSYMREKGWTTGLNQRIEGADYTITAPDGRVLHFNALPKAECSGAVQLTYDLQWVTP